MGRYGGRKMETNKVSIGSLLDERYEIKRILEADSDTARYEGWHQRVQKKVLIQEVDLQKEDIEEILFRARQLGDFSDMSGLCHVSDQFEAGDKAYIIYDYPEGICLEQYMEQKKRISEEELTEMFLPVLRNLQKLQNAGIRNLTVSPEMIYRSENGELCLVPKIVDYETDDVEYTYSVSEIFYECLSGKKPQDRFIRVLFDETEPLETCDLKGNAEFHKIVEKGMNIDSESGFQTPEELYEALVNWKKDNVSQRGNSLYFIGGCVLLGILAVAVLLGLCKKYEEQIRFLGVDTETIMLTPPDEMKQKDYKNSVEIIKNRVKKLSKNNKYWVEDDNGKIRIVIPYKLYEETKEDSKLETYLTTPLKVRIGTHVNCSGIWVRQDGDIELSQKEIKDIKEIELSNEEKHDLESEEGYDFSKITKKLEVTISDEEAQLVKNTLIPQLVSGGENKVDLCGFLEDDGERCKAEISEGDWHKIYIYESPRMEMAFPVLLDSSLKNEFKMKEEIPTDWLNRSSDLFTNWTSEDLIEEPSVKLQYGTYKSKLDEGDYYHNLGDLAGRLECLEIPYAIGTAKNNKNIFVIKVQQKNISEFVADILGGEGGTIQYGLYDRWGNKLYFSNYELKAEDDKWILCFESTNENMKEFMDPVLEDDGNVYLKVANSYEIAKLNLKEIPAGTGEEGEYDKKYYEFTFDDALMSKSGEFSEDMKPLAELFNMLGQEGNMNVDYDLKYSQYSSKKQTVSEKEESRSAWEFYPHDAVMTKETIERIDSDAEVLIIKQLDNKLYVKFHMDENYDIEEVSERIWTIWKKGKMNKGNCEVCFYINDIREGPYISIDRNHLERTWRVGIYGDSSNPDEGKFNAFKKKIQEIFSQESDVTFL